MRVRMYTPGKVQTWKRDAALRMRRAIGRPRPRFGRGVPVAVRILVVLPLTRDEARRKDPVPRRWHVKAGKGDADNFAKPVLDAANGILWHDDCQVARATVEKVTAAKGEEPRLELWAQELEEAEPSRIYDG